MKNYARLFIITTFFNLISPKIHSQTINYSVNVSKNWLPVILNGGKILESENSDSIVEPVYRYKDPFTKQFKLRNTFRFAEPFRDNGLAIVAFSGDQDYALIDTNGKVICKSPFKISAAENDHFLIHKDIKDSAKKYTLYGIVDKVGKVIIEPNYIKIDYLDEQNWYRVKLMNNKLGLIDLKGNIILDPKWEKIEFESVAGLFKDWQKQRPQVRFSNYYQKVLDFYSNPYFIVLNDKSIGSIRKVDNESYQFTYLIDGENETPVNEEIKIENGAAFFITQYREKERFAYRIKNLLGEIIFQTSFYSKKEAKKIGDDVHFPDSYQIYKTNEDKILFTLAKPGRSNIFDVVLMNFDGKIELELKKTKYYPVANMLNEWLLFMDLKLIQENNDIDEIKLENFNIKAYHPNWGLVEKVFAFDTFGNTDYVFNQNKKIAIDLFVNEVNHVIPLVVNLTKTKEPLIATDIQTFDQFLMIKFNQNHWLYEVNTQKLQSLSLYQIIDKHKLLYVDSKNGRLYLKKDSNQAKLININYPFNFQLDFKKNFNFYFDSKFIKVRYADTNFFFDFQGNLFEKQLDEITETLSPDMNSKYLAFYFQEPNQAYYKLIGYPQLKLKKISGSLSSNGSLIAQDIDGNVWYLPYKNTDWENSHRIETFPKPIFIKKDTVFDFNIFNPGDNEELSYSERIGTSGKSLIEIVFSDISQEFWIIINKKIVFNENYKGDFLNGCRPYLDFEYMGREIWLEPKTPITINNQLGSFYLLNAFLDQNGTIQAYQIDSIPFKAKTILNSFEYLMTSAELEDGRDYIKSLKHVYWLLNEKKEVNGIWNSLSKSWILDPNQNKTIKVFAHTGFCTSEFSSKYDNGGLFLLLLEKDSNPSAKYQTVKTIEGKVLLEIPASFETSFFHEDQFLGSFLDIYEPKGKQITYRINSKYEFKLNSYQLNSINEKWHSVFIESADLDSYLNHLTDDYFKLDLILKQNIPVYFDLNGELFWEN
jgi:hypothetical protein